MAFARFQECRRLSWPNIIHRPALLPRLALAALVLAPVPAQAAVNFGIDNLAGLKRVVFAQVSPDGRQVAYVLDTLPDGSGARQDDLWMVDVPSGRHSLLKAGLTLDWLQSPYILQWSPDGRRLLFNGAPEEMFVMDLTARSSRRLTISGQWLQRARWSEDGKAIGVVTSKPSATTPAPFTPGDALHIIDPATGESSQVDLKGLPPGEPSWSPDGKTIAFSANGDIYTVRIGEEPRRLVARAGPDDRPNFSPDGKTIAFMTRVGPSGGHSTLSLVPALGGEPDDVGRDIDMGLGRAPARYFAWAPDGRSIFFTKFERMAHALYRLDLGSRRISRITPAERTDIGFSVSRDGRTAAFISSNAQMPNELYVASLDRYHERRLTHSNPQLANVRLGAAERFEWRSSDGLPIEGLLMRPPGYDPKRLYPLVVVMEGTYGAFDLSFSTRGVADADLLSPFQRQVLAGQGYLLLMPNPRGSWSYGKDFSAAGRGDFAVGPNADIMSGIDELVKRHIADPDRIGIMGMYTDGYRAFYAMTHSGRFKVGVVVNGLFNLKSAYGQGVGGLLGPIIGGNPWQKRDAYDLASPFESAPSFKTPTLLIITKGDPNPNQAQADEAATALEENKVPHPTRTWEFGAFFSNSGPWMEAVSAIQDWLKTYLKPN